MRILKGKDSKDIIIQVGDVNIGKNIANLRKKRDIKQNEMVKLLQLEGIDISIYSYNRIEKGNQNPSVSLIYICSKILGCDMNEIFGYKE